MSPGGSNSDLKVSVTNYDIYLIIDSADLTMVSKLFPLITIACWSTSACLHWSSNSHCPSFFHLLYFLKDAGYMRMVIFMQVLVQFLEDLVSNLLCCPLLLVILLSLSVCLFNTYLLNTHVSMIFFFFQNTAVFCQSFGISHIPSFTRFMLLPASVYRWLSFVHHEKCDIHSCSGLEHSPLTPRWPVRSSSPR